MAGRGVKMSRGVREPSGVAGRGVKTWRHLPTRGQGARWRGRTWRQNVASLAYVASGSQVASRQNLRDAREPRAVAGALPALTRAASGVAERGVKMWRHLPTWRQGATWRVKTWRHRRHRSTWRHRTWRQNVASRSQASRHVSSKCVFSRRAICAPLTGDHPVYIYIYVYTDSDIYIYM